MTYIENTYNLIGYGGLPMADVLAVGLLAGIIGLRWGPFILGFMVFGLISIFLEEMHNRRLMRTAAVAAAAPPRYRAFLASAPAAGAPRDARS
jgi:hypothetical protein